MIEVTTELKNYGKESTLWYHAYQGEQFALVMDTKQGFLVHHPEKAGLHLIKHAHGTEVDDMFPADDEIV